MPFFNDFIHNTVCPVNLTIFEKKNVVTYSASDGVMAGSFSPLSVAALPSGCLLSALLFTASAASSLAWCFFVCIILIMDQYLKYVYINNYKPMIRLKICTMSYLLPI